MEENGLIRGGDGTLYRIRPLRAEDVEEIAALSDYCVGVNMYPREMLYSLVDRPDHYFYVLINEENRIIGYYYQYLTDTEGMVAYSKLTPEQLHDMCPKPHPVFANMKALGLVDEYRNKKLSVPILEFAVERLRALGADVAIATCWKKGDTVPMSHPFEYIGFRCYAITQLVWYDVPDLYCPYCRGRCRCDAANYYKILSKE